MIRELVKELKIFEKNEVPEGIKILGIAIYFQTSSFRRTARILSELHPVSYNAVRRWIKKIEERLPIATEKKKRDLKMKQLLRQIRSVISFIRLLILKGTS